MNKTVLVLSLTVALLVGCIVGGVATQFVVPPVRAGTNPAKWEYLCFEEHGVDHIMSRANKAGAQGWEMVVGNGEAGDSAQNWCFKRRLP